MLFLLGAKYRAAKIGLHLYDELAIFRNTNGSQIEKHKKDLQKMFQWNVRKVNNLFYLLELLLLVFLSFIPTYIMVAWSGLTRSKVMLTVLTSSKITPLEFFISPISVTILAIHFFEFKFLKIPDIFKMQRNIFMFDYMNNDTFIIKASSQSYERHSSPIFHVPKARISKFGTNKLACDGAKIRSKFYFDSIFNELSVKKFKLKT